MSSPDVADAGQTAEFLAQKTLVLTAAIAVLSRGAAALTVRNVAQAAGCSTTGVYTYFGSKNGLVDAMFIESMTSFDGAIAQAEADLKVAGTAYRSWAISHPTQYQLLFGKAIPGFEPSELAQTVAAQAFERLADLVGGHDLALHVWATIHGYVSLELTTLGLPPRPNEHRGAGSDIGAGDHAASEQELVFQRGLDYLARTLETET